MNKYTSYRVDVRPPTTTPGDGQQDVFLSNTTYSAVLRRYSDFLWLYERLHMERAGAIVPPIPEKQPVGRFSPAFVEDRRVNLERFLRRVAVHPELQDSKCLDAFLRADDVTFQAQKAQKGEAILASSAAMYASPPKQDGFKRWFAEAKTSIAGDLVKSPDDDLFDEIHRYVSGLDSQMKNVSQQATGLVRKGKEIANGLFEFGLAFNLLGQSEADALGDALGKMGETADALSVLSAEHAQREMAQFEEPLQDYIKTIHAVKLALQRRHEKRLTYSTRLAEVESKQANLSKLRAQPGQESKAYAAEMSLRRAQEASQVARDDFAAVSQRVLREVDRFKREKAEDMKRTVLDYINLQVEYNRRVEEVWAALLPQLERVQLDSNSNAIPMTPEPQRQAQTPQQSQYAPQSVPSPAVGATPGPASYMASGIDPSSMISVEYRDNAEDPMAGRM
jgi:sorting nexin-1/2